MTRRRWAMAVCVITALILVAVLPPRPAPDEPTLLATLVGFRYYGGWWWSGDRHRNMVERTTHVLTRRVLARQHAAAVIRSDAANRRSITSEREALRVVYDAGIPSRVAREWLASAEHELALYPRSGAGIPVVVELAASWPYPGDRWSQPYNVGQVVVEGSRPTCLVTRFFSREERSRARFSVPASLHRVVLDRCALYGRYGLPGRDVRRWLGLNDPWANFWYGRGASGSLRRAAWRVAADTVKWFRTEDWQIGGAINVVQCLRGNDSMCEMVSAIRSNRTLRSWWYNIGELPAGELAAHLLASQPTEAFVRFWRSELPVAEALAVAYGVPAGALVRQTLSRRYVAPAEAHTSVGRLLLAPVWILVVLGLAWVGARRKEIAA